MEAVGTFIIEYRQVLSLLLAVMCTVVVVMVWWDKVSLWWLGTWYKFPLVGKSKRLSKDYHSTTDKSGSKWLASEEALCADFATHYNKVDKDEELFKKGQDYLAKADETGRNNLHLLGWLLISALVFVEAMGFSYVLSGFTIPGASESVQKQGAMGIAFILSVLLVALTHWSGHELHANSLIKKAKAWWKQDRQRNENVDPLCPDTGINLDKTFEDDQSPQWKQLINRLTTNHKVNPSYLITTITAIAIIIIAIGATYVRGQVLEKEHIDDVSIVEQSGTSYAADDPYAEQMPADLFEEQAEADKQAQNDAWEAEKKGGWGTFIFLAFMFVFLQIFGILVGFKTGFAGKDSGSARKEIGKFKTEREFKNHYARLKQQVARGAQKQLTNLQQKMYTRADHESCDAAQTKTLKLASERTFLSYIDLLKAEEVDHAVHTHAKNVERDTRTNELAETNQTPVPVKSVETKAEKEARIRQKILAKKAAEKKAAEEREETEEEMEARLEREMEEGLV